MKDMPIELREGLGLLVICPRGDPRDVFVSSQYAMWHALLPGAVVGASSLRSQYPSSAVPRFGNSRH